ncbi:alkaline phosphatase family protein [Mucilaginibacter corticis]|uniref:Alkaline phosphatase family protein n=1 Tax=Mucilaginibacter corticis TaxID=2597670 RepID=A0A556MKL6_9SPHI|nr:alkaline phosphatase family protein [Mucilaginibacter corticis]TSJ40457.1 alkaline phosphatase family protein [Mucilaginibacter corticis]
MFPPNRITFTVIAVVLCLFIRCSKETKTPVTKAAAATSATDKKTSSTSITKPVTTTKSTDTVATVPATNLSKGLCCKTENVIIIVMDGPRYSETWGDYTRQNIPGQFDIYHYGVLLSNFHNMGTTNTDSGHDAICTGNYENLENTGQALPQYPSIFQEFLKATGKPAEKAWVVASKDKLQILGDCQQAGWTGQYQPRTDCGISGIFSGYRADDTTFAHAKNVINTYHPNLMLINFKDPDTYGHSNLWSNYIKAIQTTDGYIKAIYDMIQADPVYKDKTTLIITNDHGRHVDNVADGFVSHGDGCDGCRHIEFLAVGPDFKKGIGLVTPYEQIDISQTVAKLLNFKMDYGKGKLMTDIFN